MKIIAKIMVCGFALWLGGCAARQGPSTQGAKMLETPTVQNLPDKIRFIDSNRLGKDFTVQRFALDNGLNIIIMEDHAAPLFAYHTWVNVGSRFERPGITGIAHLFEHLMFKATKNYAADYYFNTIDTHGGQLNAGTYKDWTYYYVNIPSKNLDLITKLESERMQNLILSDEQINTERQVVIEERRFRTEDSIDGLMDEQLYLSAYKTHPYRWPVIGFRKDLDHISREDCVNFYKTYYAPNNATVVVVGDVHTKEVLETIVKYYGSIPSSVITPLKNPLEAVQQSEHRQEIKNKSILDEKATIAFHVPSMTHPDRVVLDVLNTLLVDGKSSRLYRRLVDESKIASNVGGHMDNNVEPGLFKISVALSSSHHTEEAEKIIYQEIDKLKKEPASVKEMEKTKNLVESFFVRILKTNQYKAFMLGYYHTVVGDYRDMFKEVERYHAVTAADIQRVASRYLNANNRTVIIARPGA